MSREAANIEDSPVMQSVLKFIIEFKEAHDGNSPSVGEIADGIGSGKSTVHYYLRRLEKDNAILVDGVRAIRVNGGKWRMDGDDEEKLFEPVPYDRGLCPGLVMPTKAGLRKGL